MKFGVFERIFEVRKGRMKESEKEERRRREERKERGLLFGGTCCAIGLIMLSVQSIHWWQSGFCRLDYSHTMRFVIPAVTLIALGYQTVISTFMCGLLQMSRRPTTK